MTSKRSSSNRGMILPSRPLWCGKAVIDYPTKSAVQSTFAAVARLLAPSSFLIFTYTHKGVLDGSKTFPGARLEVQRAGTLPSEVCSP